MPSNKDPLNSTATTRTPSSTGSLATEPVSLERLATNLDALQSALSCPPLDRTTLLDDAVGHPGLAIALCHCLDQWEQVSREFAQHTVALAAQLRTIASAYRDTDTSAARTLDSQDRPGRAS